MSNDIEGGESDLPVEVETAGGEEPAAATDPLAELQGKLDKVEKESKDRYDQLLRTAADFDNFRKRTRKEIEEGKVKAREEVLREILPGIDNLERAIAAASDPATNVANVVDGVKLVLRQFLSALERFEVRGFPSLDEAFDPGRHEAISQVVTEDKPAGTVAAEMQRGYTIGTKLLRPALVAVAKAPDKPEAAEAAPEAPPPETPPENEG